MWKVSISRWLNRWLGDTSGQMFCSRMYANQNWVAVVVLDFFFGESHCRQAFLWERKEARNG